MEDLKSNITDGVVIMNPLYTQTCIECLLDSADNILYGLFAAGGYPSKSQTVSQSVIQCLLHTNLDTVLLAVMWRKDMYTEAVLLPANHMELTTAPELFLKVGGYNQLKQHSVSCQTFSILQIWISEVTSWARSYFQSSTVSGHTILKWPRKKKKRNTRCLFQTLVY